MEDNDIQIGEVYEKWNASGTRVLKYTIELYHNYLNEHKLISAPEFKILQHKVKLQYIKWHKKWKSVELKKLNAQQIKKHYS